MLFAYCYKRKMKIKNHMIKSLSFYNLLIRRNRKCVFIHIMVQLSGIIPHRKRLWEPAVSAKRPDYITSSDHPTARVFSQFQELEKEKDNMFLLLSMEYGKRWREARDSLSKEANVIHLMENDFLFRRYVIRGLLLKKKRNEKVTLFKMKRFENIPSRVQSRRNNQIEHAKESLRDEIIKETEEQLKQDRIAFQKRAILKTENDKINVF
ncbi:unnamed protein product [Nezara viridula]|uniref:Uncharacterized protein n=1 Tax=Nezara viridula TaxID=85310 RepID=A0A9P0E6T7_NEZVI|nr:unnamed protein product [Nezara viridula]